jgi:general secretion pathway protein G
VGAIVAAGILHESNQAALARSAMAQHHLDLLARELEHFRLQTGEYPETLDQLVTAERQGVVVATIPVDPWGRKYVYRRVAGKRPEVVTLGADGLPGGDGEDADFSKAP